MKPHTTRNHTDRNQKGFVALFAVLVSSILLLMALSISGVAYKEQLLSINAKSSQYSFTAADAGMECALYWDVKQSWYTSGNSPESIKCGDDSNWPKLITAISTPTYFAYKLAVNANVNGTIVPGCAVFSVDKKYDNLGNGGSNDSTKIDARGYNVTCDNIEYAEGGIGIGDLRFLNGAGNRAVERLLGAVYSNN